MKNIFKIGLSVGSSLLIAPLFLGQPVVQEAESKGVNYKDYQEVVLTEVKNAPVYKDKIVNEWLRVRATPDYEAEVLRVLAPNAVVTAMEQEDGWSKIFFESGLTGYVRTDFLGVSFLDNGISLEDLTVDVGSLTENTAKNTLAYYTAEDLYVLGVLPYGEYRYTWYSEQVLAGGGLDIEGRHSDENGFICDKDDYICLASDLLEKGATVYTPFGKDGKIYDCGTGADDILDVYVNW